MSGERVWERWALAALVAGAVALAWVNRFVQDDAFISFRYARNLAEGHGLVWNVGERVEGYTNFLWTLCLAPSFWLGADVVAYSYALSLAAFVCTLLAAYGTAASLWDDRRAGGVCALLLATHFSFSCYATGGMETQFVAAWATGSLWFLSRWLKAGQAPMAMCAALSSACAVMTRMDAVLLLAPLWAWALKDAWSAGRVRKLLLPGVVGGGLVVAWMLWRHAYYGAWVPNTATIKISSGCGMWVRGAAYVAIFYALYGYVLAVPLCARALWTRARDPVFACLAGAVALWNLYVVSVGGDFMEFRMMVPMLPLALALLSGGLLACRWRWAVVFGLVALSAVQATVERKPASANKSGFRYPLFESKYRLQNRVVERKVVADALVSAFGSDRRQIKIGICPAGVIPYYSEMPTMDLLGLNDREVARDGRRLEPFVAWRGQWPGHVRMATGQQVLDKGVHLLLNQPWMASEEETSHLTAERVLERWYEGPGASATRIAWQMPSWGESRPRFPVVAWPYNGKYLITIYVKQSALVDRAIDRTHAKVFR